MGCCMVLQALREKVEHSIQTLREISERLQTQTLKSSARMKMGSRSHTTLNMLATDTLGWSTNLILGTEDLLHAEQM